MLPRKVSQSSLCVCLSVCVCVSVERVIRNDFSLVFSSPGTAHLPPKPKVRINPSTHDVIATARPPPLGQVCLSGHTHSETFLVSCVDAVLSLWMKPCHGLTNSVKTWPNFSD